MREETKPKMPRKVKKSKNSKSKSKSKSKDKKSKSKKKDKKSKKGAKEDSIEEQKLEESKTDSKINESTYTTDDSMATEDEQESGGPTEMVNVPYEILTKRQISMLKIAESLVLPTEEMIKL